MSENYSDLPKSREEAKLLKITRYLPASPCRHGHRGPRWTSTDACYECRNNARNARYQTPEGKAMQSRHDKKYRATKRGKAVYGNLSALRRGSKRMLEQLPEEWSKVQQFYMDCPSGFHVDHILPVKNKTICGLHVLENLQYLLASENLKKRNKVIPITLEACVCPLQFPSQP